MIRTVERSPQATRGERAAANEDPAVREYLIACAAGDIAAWGQLFDHLAPRLLKFLLRCLGNRSCAEAYLQATFLQLHHRCRAYKTSDDVARFVFSVAVGTRIDGRSCLDRQRSAMASTHPSSASRRGRMADQAVERALLNLSAKERALIHLHRFERMTFEQIAEVFGSTETVVQCEIKRAYQELRERLAVTSSDGDGQ